MNEFGDGNHRSLRGQDGCPRIQDDGKDDRKGSGSEAKRSGKTQ